MDVEVGHSLALLLLFLLGCLAEDEMNYNIRTPAKRPLLPNSAVSMVVDATERMVISQTKTTTSTISIKWNFLDYDFNGTYQETIVGYISMKNNGRFISDDLGNVIQEFEFRHLEPDTLYSVCVEMITVNVDETISHFKCVNMRTIPTIRTDSIVAIFLALGYLILMGLVGFTVWKRRVSKNSKNRLDEDDTGEGATVRWKDIEEKQQLNSIEESVGV